MPSIYIDTSALAKRYLNEQASAAFEAFVSERDDDFVISPLTVTEFESLLQRRLRLGDIDKRFLSRTRSLLTQDMAAALWQVHPFDPIAFETAGRLLRELDTPLATLDALHLGSALAFGCGQLATSDKQLARAAHRAGLAVHDFSSE